MNNRAYFFGDVKNFDLLVQKTKNAEKMQYIRQKYKVIDKIILADKEYELFKENILQSWDFLKDITVELNFSEEGEYLCLAVTNEHSNAIILVCSFQYSYPKFIAVVRRDSYGEKVY